jgi:hypothetical protein
MMCLVVYFILKETNKTEETLSQPYFKMLILCILLF